MTKIIFRTFVGLQRRVLDITDQDFQNWISAIAADRQLNLDIMDIVSGRRKYGDLDEGSAGIFPERIFPEDVANRLQQKLDNYSDADRNLLTIFLLQKILDTVRDINAE